MIIHVSYRMTNIECEWSVDEWLENMRFKSNQNAIILLHLMMELQSKSGHQNYNNPVITIIQNMPYLIDKLTMNKRISCHVRYNINICIINYICRLLHWCYMLIHKSTSATPFHLHVTSVLPKHPVSTRFHPLPPLSPLPPVLTKELTDMSIYRKQTNVKRQSNRFLRA